MHPLLPHSSHLTSALANETATIWDIPTHKQIQTLKHNRILMAAKYLLQGDWIATATFKSIRIWDSKDGHLLLDIKVRVTPWYNTGLLWSNNHLFIISGSCVQWIYASTGLIVSQWSVLKSNEYLCIALLKYGQFVMCSTKLSTTFWDMSSHIQLSHIQYPQYICSIALSLNDNFITVAGIQGKVIISNLSSITVSVLFHLIVEHTCNSNLSPHRIQSLCLIYTQHSRNQPLRLMTLHSIHGSSINLWTQKHHWPKPSATLRVQVIIHLLVNLSCKHDCSSGMRPLWGVSTWERRWRNTSVASAMASRSDWELNDQCYNVSQTIYTIICLQALWLKTDNAIYTFIH